MMNETVARPYGIETALQLTQIGERRKRLIARGKELALKLAPNFADEIHTQVIRAAMVKEGSYDLGLRDKWLGHVFRGPWCAEHFEWTGAYHTYSFADEHGHWSNANHIKVWRRIS